MPYSAGKYSVWNNFGGKEPWSNDICAVVGMLVIVYYILELRMRKSVNQLAAMIKTTQYYAKDMVGKNELALQKAKHEVDGHLTGFQEETLQRVEALEVAFKELVASEFALMKTTTTQLRTDLESGGLWGRQKEKLRGKLEEAAQRELIWMKAMNSV